MKTSWCVAVVGLILSGLLLGTLFPQAGVTDVQIALDASQDPAISVDVDPVTVGVGGAVRWLSEGGEAGRIEVDFAVQEGRKGPFPASGNADNPERGRYVRPVGVPIVTRGATEDDEGSWKYDIIWTASDGTVYRLDPTVVVRGDGR